MKQLFFLIPCSILFSSLLVVAQSPYDECVSAFSAIVHDDDYITWDEVDFVDPTPSGPLSESCAFWADAGTVKDWWITFTPETTEVTLSINNSTTWSEPIVALFKGSCQSLTYVDCNTVVVPFGDGSNMVFSVEPGITYYMALSDWSNYSDEPNISVQRKLFYRLTEEKPTIDCEPAIIAISNNISGVLTKEYKAGSITANTNISVGPGQISFIAKETVTLTSGFAVQSGGNFIASISQNLEICTALHENENKNLNLKESIMETSAISSIPSDDSILINLTLKIQKEEEEKRKILSVQDIVTASIMVELDLNIFPNPATTHTNIIYQIPQANTVQVGVYNLNGQVLKNVSLGEKATGEHRYQLNTENLPSGIYFVRLKTGDGSMKSQKMVVR